MTEERPSPLLLPLPVAGKVLAASGLAGWVLHHTGDPASVERTRLIQDVIDRSLSADGAGPVLVDRPTAEEALSLWRRALDRLSALAASSAPTAQKGLRQQLVARIEDLDRRLRSTR